MAKSRFTTPAMRMVQGSVDEAQTKDQQGNLRVVKTGPNAGQPNPQFFVGGAIPKNDPAWPAFWAALVNQAVADFPNLFPQGAAPVIAAGGPGVPQPGVSTLVQQGLIQHPLFSFKVIDGDGYDQDGKPNNAKEGFAGHWVVRFGSSYPPRVFDVGRYAAHEQIQEKGFIKRGYYIRVSGSIEGNGNAQRPGLYVNLDMVERTAIYHEIVSGPDASAAFAAPAALPQGVTPTMGAVPPAAGAGAPPPPPPPATVTADPMAAARAAGWQPHPQAPGYHYLGNEVLPDADVAARFNAAAAPPAAPPAPPAPPAAPAAPYTGFMQPGGAPAPAPAAPVASPPPPAPTPPVSPTASPTRVMLPAAQGASYEQMIAAGWTDDTLRANGMMQ